MGGATGSALPAVADPRFRIHFAAIERWSREIWATAYGNNREVYGTRKVHRESLNHREILSIWYRIESTPQGDELIKKGGGPAWS